MSSNDDIDATSEAAYAALEDALALFDLAGNAERIDLLRAYLEQGLADVAGIDAELYDLLADTVMLGYQRMQDLRTEVIELRLDALENPAFNMRDLVIDMVIMVSIELAVVLAPHLAVGAAGLTATLLGMRSRSATVRRSAYSGALRSARKSNRANENLVSAVGQLGNVEYELHELDKLARVSRQQYAGKRRELDALQEELSQLHARQAGNPLPLPGALFTDLERMIGLSEQEAKRLGDVLSSAQLRQKALRTRRGQLLFLREKYAMEVAAANMSTSSKLAEALSDAEERQLPPKSELAVFLTGVRDATSETLRARAAEEAGGLGQALRVTGPDASDTVLQTRNFSPSEVAADFIQRFRSEKSRSQSDIERLRLLVRYTPADQFLESPVIKQVAGTAMAAVVAGRLDLGAFREMSEPLALGFEFTCWHYWLAHSGRLHIESRTSGKHAVSGGMRDGGEGRTWTRDDPAFFHEDVLVEQEIGFFEESATTGRSTHFRAYRGQGIPMAEGFSEHITDYLYKTFSRPYLQRRAVELPFRYDGAVQAELDQAFAMPKEVRLVFNNSERDRRMKAMAAVNTFVFRDFGEQMANERAVPVFNEDGKSFGQINLRQPFDFDARRPDVSVVDAAEREQAAALKVSLGLDEDVRDLQATLALQQLVRTGLRDLDEHAWFVSQPGTEASDPYLAFLADRVTEAQAAVERVLNDYHNAPPPAEGTLVAIDEAVLEEAEAFLRMSTQSHGPIGESLDESIRRIGGP